MRGGLIAIALVATILTAIVRAQSSAHAGDWVWVADDTERRSIAVAIESAVSGMNTLSANVARMRLSLANQPTERLSVRFETDETVLTFDETEVRVPNSGTARIVGPGGERGRASRELVDRELRLRFESMRGTRHITLDVRSDRLVMKVRIESAHLPQDLRYSLTYRRVSSRKRGVFETAREL